MTLNLPIFEQYKDLVHGFSTAREGNMSFKYGPAEEVEKNRKNFLDSLGVPSERCVMMSAVHGAEILPVTAKNRMGGLTDEARPEVDALTTNERGLYLLLLVADCLPILYYDPRNAAVGLAHCGWKGTEEKLAAKVVGDMVGRYGSRADELLVGVGPGIHRESYAFVDPAQKRLPGWEEFLTDLPDGRTAIDIVGYNVHQLVAAGIAEKHIEVSGVDTATSAEMFSHYRSARTGEPEGRFCAVIGTKK